MFLTTFIEAHTLTDEDEDPPPKILGALLYLLANAAGNKLHFENLIYGRNGNVDKPVHLDA